MDCEPPVVVGPPGPQGPPGEPGPQGPPGEPGTNGTTTATPSFAPTDVDVEGVTIKGTRKADVIDTGDSFFFSTTAGNDYVFGLKGKDTLRGGDGNDTLWGGKGKDHLWGDAGDDVLYGGAKADTYHAQGGGSDSFRWTKHDTADFSGIVKDYASLKGMMTQQANGVLIDLGNGDSVLLGKAKIAKLDADHFDF